MKKLFHYTPMVLLVIIVILLLHQKNKLETELSARPEIRGITPNTDHKFFVVFKSGKKHFAVVAKMRHQNDFDEPFVTEVGEEIPLSSEGYTTTYGVVNDVGIIRFE